MTNNKLLTINIRNKKQNGVLPFEKHLKRFCEQKKDFTHFMTGYTDAIHTEEKNIIFSNDSSNLKIFIAKNKIISDYKNCNTEIENIPRSIIHYYKLKPHEFNYEKAILIDINSAYPTILKNYELITNETFEYLMKLKKGERLKAIGSLATQKIKTEYLKGSPQEAEVMPRGEFSQLYFFCAYEIGEALQKSSAILPNSFLFYWFDGIYLKYENNEQLWQVTDYFREINLDFKILVIYDFISELDKRGNFKIRWTESPTEPDKNNPEKSKTKKITIPKK
jgi:hypothetical protein